MVSYPNGRTCAISTTTISYNSCRTKYICISHSNVCRCDDPDGSSACNDLGKGNTRTVFLQSAKQCNNLPLHIHRKTQMRENRFDFYMLTTVQNQVGGTTEFLITIGTFDRFARVQCQMRFQYRLLRKCFITEMTSVWFFTGL